MGDVDLMNRQLLTIFFFATAVALTVAACSSLSGYIAPPPEIPGATFIGSDGCAICHDGIATDFAHATHAILRGNEAEIEDIACESCHGPGSAHVEAGGGSDAIVNPGRSPEACFRCHLDTRGDFALPHKHPVTTGPLDLTDARMACGDCHDPHAGRADAFAFLPMTSRRGGAQDGETRAQSCLGCHPAQQGPFVFEHEAMREGCVTCHAPHGSVNSKMLTETNATLCLKCHFQEQPRAGVVLIGGQDHSFFLSQGSCYSSGCHEAVHGSQVSSSLRY